MRAERRTFSQSKESYLLQPSIIMFHLLFLASIVRASVYDPVQIPLKDSRQDVVAPLTVCIYVLPRMVMFLPYLPTLQFDTNLHYTFPAFPENSTLEALQQVTKISSVYAHDTVTIAIPLDPTATGSVTFSHDTDLDISSPLTWLPTTTSIGLDHIGIRKGGMISKPVWFAKLSLETPYIMLPKEIFDVLLQAARTTPVRGYVVDCDVVAILPDLVFGLDSEDEEGEAGEIVVRPEQYVMEIEKGMCVLLARSSGDGMEGLGWAAIRGREFVLDRSRGMMGFGS
jgi:hypothetical protein